MITNRDKQAKASDFDCLKHPGRFLKTKASRMLRRDHVEAESDARPWPSRIDSRRQIKRSGVCPLCLERLKKNARGTRYERCCQACRAQWQPDLKCLHCSGEAIWSGAGRSICKRCGRSGAVS
jgi:hypothetical protein